MYLIIVRKKNRHKTLNLGNLNIRNPSMGQRGGGVMASSNLSISTEVRAS